MPLLDGDKATILIREYESGQVASIDSLLEAAAYGRIPIIAVSASLSESRVHEYVEAGFDGWISKPIDFKRLKAILTAVRDKQTRETLLYVSGHWDQGGWFQLKQDDFSTF